MLCQFATCADGIVVVDVEHFVYQRGIIGLGHETCTNALNLMRTALTTVENRRREGLYGNNLYVGILLLEVFGNTADGSSCAYTGNEDIYLSIGILPDLRTGCGIVACWIGTVFKLLQDDTAWYAVAQFFGDAEQRGILKPGATKYLKDWSAEPRHRMPSPDCGVRCSLFRAW